MLSIRSARERGRSDLGWLDSRHTFSFGRYFDPEHMGFGPLRVINEDRVAPGRGFEAHGHRDMEILSIVLSGELEHRDSMGNGSVIRTGEVQRMSAGTGITHSEYNHSAEEPVHFLQIWIEPEATGLAPGYEQRNFESRLGMPEPALLASRDGRDGSLTIHQDVDLLAIRLPEGASLSLPVRPGRSAWVQVLRGGLALAGASLGAGDGAALADVSDIRIDATTSLDVLVFDMNASATHRGR
jgi:redox-sensitive bicupin YhaK (pirin superfamily)